MIPDKRGDLAMVTISLALGLEHHSGQELYYICVQAGSIHTLTLTLTE